MFKKALVGVDLSPAEASLLSCLPDLNRWGIESLVLAHVIRIGYGQGAGFGHEDEYQSWLEEHAAPLREAGLTVTTLVTASGVPADELLAAARAQHADLVVVGSRSHSFIHDLFLGSVARDVIRKSTIPVLIERLEPTKAGTAGSCAAVCRQKLDRILLATDLSEQSRAAEDAAVTLAPNAAQTDCLTVLPPEDADLGVDNAVRAGKKLSAIIKRIEAAGGHGHSRIEHGDPAEVIARVGQEGCSLIVVGKHGKNWIEGIVSGNTAAKVCELAKCPVLMVPLGKG